MRHLKPIIYVLITFLVIGVLGTPGPARAAATWTVSNLNDSGSGSLRDAINNAASGDTINFAGSVTGTTYYTTDGSDPTTSSTRIAYKRPFAVSRTMTVKAANYTSAGWSTVTTASFTIGGTNSPWEPAFFPPEGSFTDAHTVYIYCPGADWIYYTTDGSNPATSSTRIAFQGSFTQVTVSQSETIKAISYNSSGYSNIARASFTVGGPSLLPTPVVAPNGGSFTSAQTVMINDRPGTIYLSSPLPKINKNLTIVGPGAANLSISGNYQSRVFEVDGGTVSISGLTVENGWAYGNPGSNGGGGLWGGGGGGGGAAEGGGGLLMKGGTATIDGVNFLGNQAIGGKGGSGGVGWTGNDEYGTGGKGGASDLYTGSLGGNGATAYVAGTDFGIFHLSDGQPGSPAGDGRYYGGGGGGAGINSTNSTSSYSIGGLGGVDISGTSGTGPNGTSSSTNSTKGGSGGAGGAASKNDGYGYGGNGGNGGDAYGGAVCLVDGYLRIINSAFTGNSALGGTGGPGGPSGKGFKTWTGTLDNLIESIGGSYMSVGPWGTGAVGGLLKSQGTSTVYPYSGYAGNGGNASGGAIYVGPYDGSFGFNNAPLVIVNSTFNDNSATGGYPGPATDWGGIGSFFGRGSAYDIANYTNSSYVDVRNVPGYISTYGKIRTLSGPDPAYSRITADGPMSWNGPNVTANGIASATITVNLRDKNNMPIWGETVTLGQGSGHSVISPASAVTDADGNATFTVTDSWGETINYTAIDPTFGVTVYGRNQTVWNGTQNVQTTYSTVTFIPGPPNAGQSTVSASQSSVPADGATTSTITVTLKDASGHPWGGQMAYYSGILQGVPVQGGGKTVILDQGSGHSVISPASITIYPSGNGTATFTVTGSRAEQVTYTARVTTDNLTVSQTAAVTFTPPDPGQSTVAANLSSVPADGATSSTITVTLKFADGTPAVGKTVTLSQAAGSSSISPASATTDSNGTATFTVTDSVAETVSYTAKDPTDNLTLSQTATVTFNPYTWSVNTLADTNNPGSLRYAVTNAPAGTTVIFQSGLTGTINLQGTLVINKNLIIDGSGADVTISGQNQYRVFQVDGGTVSIKGLTIANGKAAGSNGPDGTLPSGYFGATSGGNGSNGNGGGLLVTGGTVTIDSVAFNNNGATGGRGGNGASSYDVGTSSGSGAGGYGGAVYLTNGSLTINNSWFNGNYASGGSGGSGGSSKYGGNAGGSGGSGYGGAVFVNAGSLTITGSQFANNSANGGSGGNAGPGGWGFIKGGNGGSGYGGAIYVNSGSLTVTGSEFSNDLATGSNGGSGGSNAQNGGTGGTGGSGYGGAIMNSSGTLTITDIQFTNDSATGGNGGAGGYGYSSYGRNGSNGGGYGLDLCNQNGAVNINNVTFDPGNNSYYNLSAVDAAQSTVTASPASVLADGTTSATITVTLKIANGSPVAGKTVTLSQGSGNSVITTVYGVSRNDGTVVFTVTDNVAETVYYTARDTTDNVTLTEQATVTFTLGSLDINTLNDGSNPGTLRYVMQNAPSGSVITFPSGLSGTIVLKSPLPVINKDLTIDGSGASVTISGNNLYRVFEVDGGTVAIENLTIADGLASGSTGSEGKGGGLLVMNGTVSVRNVTFRGNQATGGSGVNVSYGNNGGNGGHGKGGAIFVNGGSLTVSNSMFDGNNAGGGKGGSGSGMYWYSGTGGSGYGGAIYVSSGVLSISNTQFAGNTAVGGQGGDGDGTSYYDNTYGHWNYYYASGGNGGNGYGGALFVDAGSLTITGSQFDGNIVNYGGGGICPHPYWGYSDNGRPGSDAIGADLYNRSGVLSISNVNFAPGNNSYHNSSPPDAAQSTVTAGPSSVLADGVATSTVTVSLKDANGSSVGSGKVVTLSQGSGKSVISPSATAITDPNGTATFTVTDNQVETVTYTAKDTTDNMTVSQTAAVTFNAYGWSLVNSLNDTNNSGTLRYALTYSPSGSTIIFQNGLSGTITLQSPLPAINKDLTIDGSGANVTVSGNNRYRVFEVDGGTVSIVNLTIADGLAAGSIASDGKGGGLLVMNGTVSVRNVTFHGNQATGGSGVNVSYGNNGGNGGNGKGGAIFVNGGSLTVSNSTFDGDNAVGGKGGNGNGINWYGGTGGSGYGGAIYVSSGSLSISNSQFAGNSAVGGQGGYGDGYYSFNGYNGYYYYASGGTGGNGYGGALFIDTGLLTITGSQFDGNSVTYGSGGICPYPYLGYSANGVPGSAVGKDVYNQNGVINLSNVTFAPGNDSYYNSFTPDPGHSTVTAGPAGVPADGDAFSTITVTLKDANGSPVGSGKTVTLSPGSGNSHISTASATTDGNGRATFTVTDSVVETVYYTATVNNITVTQTAWVNFLPPEAGQSTITASAANVPANGANTTTITVVMRYANGHPAVGKTVTLSQGSGSSSISPASAITDAGGRATFTVTNAVAETVYYTATDTSDNVTVGRTLGVIFSGPATRLVVTDTAASPQAAGNTFNVTVTAEDRNGNPAVGYTGTVHFTSSDANGALPADYTFISGDTGTHTFPVTLGTTGTQTVTVTDTVEAQVYGTSGNLAVVPGAAGSLTVISSTSTPTAGTPFDITVTAKDRYGNTLTGYTGKVHFTSSDANGALPLDYIFVTGDSGTHTFPVKLETAGAQTVTVTDTVEAQVYGTSGNLAVVPGAAGSLTVVSSTSTPTAGTPFNVTVTAKDRYGNKATGYTGTVHFSTNDGNGPGGMAPSLPADYTFTTADAETHTFSVTLYNPATATLTVTDSVYNITGISGNILVLGRTDSGQSTVAASTYGYTANGMDTSTITVTLRDADGNLVMGKPVELSQGSGSSSILPARAITGADGTASFTVTDTKAETVNYTARDTANNVTLAQSVYLTFIPGPAAKLAWQTQPGGGAAGVPWMQQPVLVVEDVYGNVVTNANMSTVTLALTNPSGATLNGTKTAQVSGSVAAFSDLSMDKAGTYTLTATAGSLTSPASDSFTIAAGLPGNIILNVSPASTPADGISKGTVSATVYDIYNNPVPNVAVGFSTNLGRLAAPSVITGVYGQADATISSDAAGMATVQAQVYGGGPVRSTRVAFVPVQGIPITSTTVNVDDNNKNLDVTPATVGLGTVEVNIPANVANATVNVGALLNAPSGGTVTTGVLPEINISAVTAVSTSPVRITIPTGTTVTVDAAASWDGTIFVPTVQANNTVTVTPDAGKTAAVNTVIEVGFGDTPLTFSKAVRILIPGQSGSEAGYYRNGVFTKITSLMTADSQAAGDALPAGGDGIIAVGSDLVIWTKHFTQFVTYTQTNTSPGPSGSSGFKTNPALPPVTPAGPAAGLHDISGHWAKANIEKLSSLGAIGGYPDGTFRPDHTITRAEFAAILVKAFKLGDNGGPGKVFADTAGHWASDAIATAAANGIVSGYSDGNFGPDDPITREQMAFMIVKAAKLSQVSGEPAFTDSGRISSWAQRAVVTAVQYGIITGYPGNTFSALGKATRAEAVTAIVNAIK